jgi:HEAT repeat protein
MQNTMNLSRSVFEFIAIVGSHRSLLASCAAFALLSACGPSVDSRVGRAYELGRHPTELNKNRIESLLGDGDRDVRATALVVMGTVDGDRARRMALRALTDPDGLVRAVAVPLSSDGTDVETVRRIAALSANDPVWQVRTRALEAIADSDDPAVRQVFDRALSDSVRHVRRAALRAGIDHPGLLSIGLVSNLVASDPDWENRVEAAAALGASKDPAAYASLDVAAADRNEFVRTTAARERRELERAGVPR